MPLPESVEIFMGQNQCCTVIIIVQAKFIVKQKVSLITFAAYVYSDDAHVLTAEKAFVCLTLFDIIRLPLVMLPLITVYMVEVIDVNLEITFLILESNNTTGTYGT